MKIAYILQRLLVTFIVFVLVVTLCFFIPRIGVEDPCTRFYPPQGSMNDADFEVIKELTREQYGLNGSHWSQYIRYMKGLFSGDLGTSYQAGSPKVVDLIAERLPWTLVLSVSSMLISMFFGIIIGARCAIKRGSRADRMLMNASTITTAIPSFFVALLMSLFLGFQLELFPAYTDQNMVSSFTWSFESIKMVAYNAALPVISVSIGGIVGYAQNTRDSVIAVANENYVLTAKAKGVSAGTVTYKHILRNALLPIVTGLGMGLAGLIDGSVVIEKIFNWQGVGTLYLEANNNNDYPLMMGIMIFMASVALVGNLLADFCYGLLDKRVTLEKRR